MAVGLGSGMEAVLPLLWSLNVLAVFFSKVGLLFITIVIYVVVELMKSKKNS